ncbi:MAG: inositol monophosphatase [Candidatus Omnitrophota bacterium]
MKGMMDLALRAAREAGDFLLDNFGKISLIESKGDRNLVTNLDKEAEKIILDKIRSEFPGHGIISEEDGVRDPDKEYVWIIDPLDGTHNYIRNVPVFGVSIGIVRNKEFVGGAVYMPFEKEMYAAEKGAGAHKNGARIRVSSKSDLRDCSLSFDSSIRYSPDVMLKVLGELSKEVFNVRMFGSSARLLTYVADGRIDAAVEFHDFPWDFAGSVAIIEEAGGKISCLKQGKISCDSVGYVASNGILHDSIRKIVTSYL